MSQVARKLALAAGVEFSVAQRGNIVVLALPANCCRSSFPQTGHLSGCSTLKPVGLPMCRGQSESGSELTT